MIYRIALYSIIITMPICMQGNSITKKHDIYTTSARCVFGGLFIAAGVYDIAVKLKHVHTSHHRVVSPPILCELAISTLCIKCGCDIISPLSDTMQKMTLLTAAIIAASNA